MGETRGGRGRKGDGDGKHNERVVEEGGSEEIGWGGREGERCALLEEAGKKWLWERFREGASIVQLKEGMDNLACSDDRGGVGIVYSKAKGCLEY